MIKYLFVIFYLCVAIVFEVGDPRLLETRIARPTKLTASLCMRYSYRSVLNTCTTVWSDSPLHGKFINGHAFTIASFQDEPDLMNLFSCCLVDTKKSSGYLSNTRQIVCEVLYRKNSR